MNDFFTAIEQSGLSVWMRDDPYAYFLALILHAWGMALLVGAALVLCLPWLGFARGVAVAKLCGFVPVLWWGAALAVPSGVLLLLAYPAKALTNPLFAVKLACLAAAVLLMRMLLRHGADAGDCADAGREAAAGSSPGKPASPVHAWPARMRLVALLALLLWLGVVIAGKLLLHTYSVLTVS